tara:strand:+ start:368 stop:745 length:378 start_codon:yes stop_codon:yes gene_type:complete
MKVEEKPDMKVHGSGKPYFSWKKKGSDSPTHLFKMLIGHIAQHFMAHERGIDYTPSSQENAFLARTFSRWLGDIYSNVDEMHWRAVEQQIKWLFTKQDLLAVSPKQKHMVQLHFLGRNMLEDFLK